MSQKKESPASVAASRAESENTDIQKVTKKATECQEPKVLFPPQIRVSKWTYDKLCKIQAAKGIPLDIWVETELIKSIYREWDFQENKPRRIAE